MRITTSVIAVSLIAGTVGMSSASAADLAARPYTKAPILVDPGYNWTGFYVGLNGGYSWGSGSTTLLPASIFATFVRQDVNGGLFGGQAGYNWQVNPKWVVGVEADIQWTGERGRLNGQFASVRLPVPLDFNTLLTDSADSVWSMPWFATFRGRAGVLVDPSLLLYGTGGLAVGEVKFATQLTASSQLFGPGANGLIPQAPAVVVVAPGLSESQTRLGWTLGAGAEKKINKNWSAKAEYLYLDFGTKTYFGGTANAVDVRFHDHIFRAGFNYAFTPAAIVARY